MPPGLLNHSLVTYGPSPQKPGTLASSCPHSPTPTSSVDRVVERSPIPEPSQPPLKMESHLPRGKAGGHLQVPKVLAHSSALGLAYDAVQGRTETGSSGELPAVLMLSTDDNGGEWWGRSFRAAVLNDSHCALAIL